MITPATIKPVAMVSQPSEPILRRVHGYIKDHPRATEKQIEGGNPTIPTRLLKHYLLLLRLGGWVEKRRGRWVAVERES